MDSQGTHTQPSSLAQVNDLLLELWPIKNPGKWFQIQINLKNAIYQGLLLEIHKT